MPRQGIAFEFGEVSMSMFSARVRVGKSIVVSLLIGCNGSVASKANFGISAFDVGQSGGRTEHGSVK